MLLGRTLQPQQPKLPKSQEGNRSSSGPTMDCCGRFPPRSRKLDRR